MRLHWLRERLCQFPGCKRKAPGTHPLCRMHAREVPRAEYRALRFGDDPEPLLREAIARIKGQPPPSVS